MTLQSFPGQPHIKQILQRHLQTGRISHAYIFEGPAGTGKQRMAEAFAQALLCASGGEDACGECLECRKAEHGNHPDLHWVEPDGASIKIDQIRELQKQFAYRTAGDGRKIYILTKAEALTDQAANSLLKFLEEPGAGVTALLLTDNRQALLPTVRSRAQLLSFVPLSAETMLPELLKEGFAEGLARPAVHLAAGLDEARKIIQSEWFAEIRNVSVQLARECLHHSVNALLTAQEKLFKSERNEHLDTLLTLLALCFKDMIYIQCGKKDKLVFADQSDWLNKAAFERNLPEWVSCMEQTIEAKKRLRFHANPQLVLEQLLNNCGKEAS